MNGRTFAIGSTVAIVALLICSTLILTSDDVQNESWNGTDDGMSYSIDSLKYRQGDGIDVVTPKVGHYIVSRSDFTGIWATATLTVRNDTGADHNLYEGNSIYETACCIGLNGASRDMKLVWFGCESSVLAPGETTTIAFAYELQGAGYASAEVGYIYLDMRFRRRNNMDYNEWKEQELARLAKADFEEFGSIIVPSGQRIRVGFLGDDVRMATEIASPATGITVGDVRMDSKTAIELSKMLRTAAGMRYGRGLQEEYERLRRQLGEAEDIDEEVSVMEEMVRVHRRMRAL